MKNTFFLNFSNLDHEKLYKEYFAKVKLRKMGILLFIENLSVVILQAYIWILYGDHYSHYIFLFSAVFALFAFVLIVRFYSRLLFLFLNVNFIALIIYNVELMRYYKTFWPDSENLLLIALNDFFQNKMVPLFFGLFNFNHIYVYKSRNHCHKTYNFNSYHAIISVLVHANHH